MINKKDTKEDIDLSIKLGKSRPVNYNENRTALMKRLFSIKISKTIENFDVLINIDQSMFSRSTKTSYSWLAKGEDSNLMNI